MAIHKKITVWMLICIFMLALSQPLLFSIPNQIIKISQSRVIKQSDAVPQTFIKIILTATEFKQNIKEGEDEIEFNHQMYDIKRVSKKDGHYIILALADSKETNWNKFKTNILAKQNHNGNPEPFVFMFLFYEKLINLQFSGPNAEAFESHHYQFVYCTHIPAIPTPPPDGNSPHSI